MILALTVWLNKRNSRTVADSALTGRSLRPRRSAVFFDLKIRFSDGKGKLAQPTELRNKNRPAKPHKYGSAIPAELIENIGGDGSDSWVRIGL